MLAFLRPETEEVGKDALSQFKSTPTFSHIALLPIIMMGARGGGRLTMESDEYGLIFKKEVGKRMKALQKD
jgi:hypothetical protein